MLQRALLAGLRDRSILERGDTVVGGRPASRVLAEGRTFVDGACVVDLFYAAPVDAFAAWAPDFARFAASFARE